MLRPLKIAIGSDHAGFEYKEKIRALLTAAGHEVRDFGTFNAEPVDYPLFIRPTAEAVARGEFERGIVLFKVGLYLCRARGRDQVDQ